METLVFVSDHSGRQYSESRVSGLRTSEIEIKMIDKTLTDTSRTQMYRTILLQT